MSHRFTRKKLHELVWSQPMRTLAASVGVSDVALAKACKKANIPVPERGFWARRQAGKTTIERPLPPRFPGAPDTVQVGGDRSSWDPNWRQALLNDAIPPAPQFDEAIDTVSERVKEIVGKVHYPKQIS